MFSTTESGPGNPGPTPDPLEAFPQRSLEAGDIAVLALYFLFVLAVGLWVSQPGAAGREETIVTTLPFKNALELTLGQV